MIDVVSPWDQVETIEFFSDASASRNLGFGCLYQNNWIQVMWEEGFIDECKPSIEFLELYALIAGILTWEKKLSNRRVAIFCDNMGVVHMVNGLTSSCQKCMLLLRILVLNNMIWNHKVMVRYISTNANDLADALSRNQMKRFRKLGPHMNELPDNIHPSLWPLSDIWFNATFLTMQLYLQLREKRRRAHCHRQIHHVYQQLK